MRLLVTGTRDSDGGEILRREMESIVAEAANDNGMAKMTLIHGAAKGIDKAAEAIAIELGFTGIFRFPAEWDYYFGKQESAGPERNREMLETMPPHLCLAFPGPKSKGTGVMVRMCEDMGIPVSFHPVR